jgi:hypothetical protein
VTYRRTTTVVSSLLVSLLAVVLAVAVSAREGGSTFPLAVAAVVVALSMVSGALPRLVTTASHLRVHNMFVRLDVPYEAITEVVDSTRGLWLRTGDGRRITVAAFGHSTLSDLLTGNAAAHAAAEAVDAMRADRPPAAASPPIDRHFSVPAIAAVLVAVLALLLAGL